MPLGSWIQFIVVAGFIAHVVGSPPSSASSRRHFLLPLSSAQVLLLLGSDRNPHRDPQTRNLSSRLADIRIRLQSGREGIQRFQMF